MAVFRSVFALLALMAVSVLGQCVSYGVDFENNGQYYIDASSNQYFNFKTIFQGCSQETINPVLVSPDGNQYSCSSINTQPAGREVTSTCGIPYSSMKSGQWRVVMAGDQVQVQRTLNLVVGMPETSTVTATPTIVLGITSTPKAVTVQTTLQQTVTLILVPSTVSANCQGGTQTVTNLGGGATVTVQSTLIRTVTDGQKTSYWQTTSTAQASCHYSNKKRVIEAREEAAEEAVEAENAVMAQTVTYTQTTYTVTQTMVTTIPAVTTTEVALRTVTATVAPPPSTVCTGGGRQVTVTVGNGSPQRTQTNIIYSTTHLSGTVWVGQTQYTTISNAASATACWRAGGWYGH